MRSLRQSATTWLLSLLGSCALVLAIATPVSAQDRVEVRGTGGGSLVFLDDPWYGTGGGAVHFRVSSRFHAGGEVLYMARSGSHNVLTVMPVVTWTFRQTSRVHPYLIGAVGWARRRHPTGTGIFESNQVAANGGIGAKFLISDRVFVAPEFRMGGDEPVMIVTGSVGIRF
jgi:hypothetical protein